MLIKELVKLDTQGKFISDVQLSNYDYKTDNTTLLKSYIFADSAPDTHGSQSRVVSSIQLLREIRLSYINSSPVNRFVVVANYGHGKSHLALVLANFFSKPYQSPEVKEVLGRIDITLHNNLSEAENFREFKKQYDRFLVVRLRGDTPRTLREQFFPALKKAMEEHPATQNADLPFWYQQAKQWIQSKADDKIAKQFLKESFNTDIPNLLQDVEKNKQEAYEQYIQLFAHLNNGVSPNAEGNFSLREAVIWVVDSYCKDAKPLAGLVILFDEFSQFIERYSQSKAVGDLQDLLNGIGDLKGKALFVAFAQHDPDEVAERQQGGQTLQNIKRELSRIDRKYALYSLMESVLNAYLAQSEPAWDKFLKENPRVKGYIYGQATELVWDLYHNRYDQELRWTNDKFRDVVTKGCYPLHPFTTALLCHLKMRQGVDDDPRTILKFVRDRFESKQNEVVLSDDKINWILPIELINYFGPRVATEQHYSSYENAIDNLEQVFGDSATQEQRNILQALLLQIADGINVTGEKQVELISQMVGLDNKSTVNILKELGKSNITKFDENTRFNSFWPVAANPKALEQKIREIIDDKKFGDDELSALNDKIATLISGADHIEVSIKWGTPSDWAANAAIITRSKLTKDYLEELTRPYRLSSKGLQDGCRGFVGWLMALDDSDIEYFIKNAPEVLHETLSSETPPPIMLILPQIIHKKLADQFLRYQALETISKNKDSLKEIGQTTYDAEFQRTTKELIKAIGELLDDETRFASIPRKPKTIVVPQAYKPSLAALATVSIQSVLLKLYELAYPYRSPEFFTDLPANPKRGASPLREGVKTVSKNLLFNRVGSTLAGMTPLARDRICQQQLFINWHLLSSTSWIQEPDDILSLKHTWDYLEEQIKPDEKEVHVKNFIPNLFNSPFGFDYNTATLLFTAWIGKHNNELRFYAKTKVVGLEYLENLIDKGTPQDFLGNICTEESLAITRRDADKALTEGRDLVDSIQKGESRNQKDAANQLSTLNEIVNQVICAEDEKDIFSQAIIVLNTALESAEKYDQDANKILSSISGENDLTRLLALIKDIKHLDIVELVTAYQPSVTEIQEKLDYQIKKVVEATCVRAEKLNRLEGADSVRDILNSYKSTLKQKPDLLSLVSAAEAKLDIRVQELKEESEEAAKCNQINAMTSSADLAKLYQYEEILQAMINGSSSLTEIKSLKLEEIQASISALVTFAENATKEITVVNQEQANTLFEQILRNDGRYAGTNYESALKQAREQLVQVRSYFNDLTQIENASVRDPEDVRKLRERISQCILKYDKYLGENQKSDAIKFQHDLDNREQLEISKTEKWIASLEDEFTKGKVVEVRAKLIRLPTFLTPELNKRIDILHSKLNDFEAQERIAKLEKEAKDVMERIEKLFLSISDPKIRKECLDRLQNLH
ncbi:MAG: hypothetical protein JW704_11050 [Anaerolineaceae bacterium]|nr:hypothetical protein [Anaerolineaceae bacterium]